MKKGNIFLIKKKPTKQKTNKLKAKHKKKKKQKERKETRQNTPVDNDWFYCTLIECSKSVL